MSAKLLLSAAFAFTSVHSTEATDLADVLRHPQRYHHEHVSLVGVARVQGVSFVLYQNARDAEQFAKPSKALSVAERNDAPSYDRFDRRWVVVTGIIAADRHGMWHYPCELLLEKVAPAKDKPKEAIK